MEFIPPALNEVEGSLPRGFATLRTGVVEGLMTTILSSIITTIVQGNEFPAWGRARRRSPSTLKLMPIGVSTGQKSVL
ncbi:MAG: hypothetical protein WBB64_06590 [Anaerolineales bacterium]